MRTKPSSLALKMLAVLSISTLAGCATLLPTAGLKPAAGPVWGATDWTPPATCLAFDRITFDRLADTTETIARIKVYNAQRDALCGVGK